MYVSKRQDNTFETLINDLPYHVTQDSPLFSALAEEYAALPPGKAVVDGKQTDDNRGRAGWVNGQPFIMEDFGQLPKAFSDTPPEPAMEEALAAKLAEVMRGYSAAFAPVEAVYPAAEREGWPVQEAEARALMADPQAETPVLSALVQLRARGETVAALAEKVLANAGQWRMVYAYLTGQQQRMYGEVTALAAQEGITGADVAAYPVEYRMPEGL